MKPAMKTMLVALFAPIVAAGPVLAQTGQPATPARPPVNAPAATAPAAQLSEQEVLSVLEKNGFSGVTGLEKDGVGTWRGTAMRNGAKVTVTVDAGGRVAVVN